MSLNSIDIIILSFAYIIFSIIIVIDIIIDINKFHKIKIFSFFKIFYLITYGITPLVSINVMKFDKYTINYITTEIKYYYISLLVSILFYIIFRICLYFFAKIKEKKIKKYLIKIDSSRFYIISVIFMFIGAFSQYMWTKAYGYPFGIIKYANLIRSGYSPIVNKYTFFKPLCYFSLISFYQFFIIFMKNKKIITSLFMTYSLFNSMILILANDGRMLLLIFFLVIALYFINENIKIINLKFIVKIVLCAIIALVLLGNIDNFTYYIRNGIKRENSSNNGIINIIYNEFSFTHKNNINVLYLKDNNRLVKSTEKGDIKNIILAWIPERYKEDSKTLFDINTDNYSNISGQIPTDIISASIYKFSYLGIIIIPIVVNFILYFIEAILSKYNSEFIKIMYNLIGTYVALRLVDYYDLSTIIFGCFYIIISLFLVIILCRRSEYEYIEKNM